ncbi:hypothetical protein [uncultured Marinobacter sp.]|uniref:hypothetical protein n=1 Tax=uncultured Marinobacter sp. TaxID=187379 RepID=UPI002590255D|nr:hypothetical protein [uncultured Marinobacter sp.]
MLKNFYALCQKVSSAAQTPRERIFITYSGSVLALGYDFTSCAGDEVTGLTCVRECDMGSSSWPEHYCKALKSPLAEAVTESDIEAASTLLRPYIDAFKKIFDRYQSDESDIDFDNLRQEFFELKSSVDDCVSSMVLDLQSIRGCDVTAEAAFYDSGVLEDLVTPTMSDREIQETAWRAVFVDGDPFHPEEIVDVLIHYRDNLLEDMDG